MDFLNEDPNDVFSLYALAHEYAATGNNTEAINLLKKTELLDENYVALYYQLGKLYEMKKQIEQAKLTYLKGINIARNNKKMHALSELQGAYNMLMDEED
jgi:tetratricopeptide (TPR) repeat protein